MTAAHARPFDLRDLAVVIAINLLWGLNLVAVKMSVTATTPFAAGLLRQLIVLLACFPALRVIPGQMYRLTGLGFLTGALLIICINISLMVTDNVSALSIATQLGVPFALILAVLFLRERIGWRRLLGVALAFGGVLAMMFDPAVLSEGLGVLLAAGSCLVWAIGSLLQRGLRDVPVFTIYAWIGLIGASCLFPLCLVLEPQSLWAIPDMPLKGLGWIAFSALGSTLCGHGGMSWLLQRHPVSVVTPMTLASPVVAVAAASLYFDTELTVPMLVGGGMALGGVAIITFHSRAAHRPEHGA